MGEEETMGVITYWNIEWTAQEHPGDCLLTLTEAVGILVAAAGRSA